MPVLLAAMVLSPLSLSAWHHPLAEINMYLASYTAILFHQKLFVWFRAIAWGDFVVLAILHNYSISYFHQLLQSTIHKLLPVSLSSLEKVLSITHLFTSNYRKITQYKYYSSDPIQSSLSLPLCPHPHTVLYNYHRTYSNLYCT